MKFTRRSLRCMIIFGAVLMLPGATGCNQSMRREVRSAAYDFFQTGVATLFDELTVDLTSGIRNLGGPDGSAAAAE